MSVKDASVSRNHALILARQGHLTVKDLNSSNGTFLNGMRIFAEAELHDGDTLMLGESEMRVRIVPPESVAATMRIDPRALLAGEELRLQAEEEAKAALVPGAVPVRSPLPPPPSAVPPVPRPSLGPPLRDPASIDTGPTPLPALQRNPPPLPPVPPSAPPAPPPPAHPPAMPPPMPRTTPQTAPPPPAAPRPAASAVTPAMPPPAPAAEPEPVPASDIFALPDLDLPPLPPAEEAPKVSPVLVTRVGAAPALALTTTPAGFWPRAVAVLLDSLLLGVIATVLFFATGSLLDDEQRLTLVSVVWFGLDLILRFVGWSVWGTTPGKRLLGLHVFPAGSPVPGIGFGKGFLRCLGYWVSGATLGIGFLMVAFTQGKRGLHDMIAGTMVGRTTPHA